MTAIKYVEGDVTEAQSTKHIYIPHVCNDIGGWGRGFVLALSSKWTAPERDYRKAAESGLQLGQVIDSIAESGRVYVANMVAQHGTSSGTFSVEVERADGGGSGFFSPRPPIRYGALAKCMRHVAALAKQTGAEIHAPRFGSGLAGGDWNVIESMILELWSDAGIPVTIYDLQRK